MRRLVGQGCWMSGMLGIALALTCWLTPAVAHTRAANAAATPAPVPTDYEHLPFMKHSNTELSAAAPSAGGLLLRSLGALLLILGLLLAATWGLRRWGGARFAAAGPDQEELELAVIATVPLGERRTVSAVRFGNQTLLLGSTAQAVTLLATTERAVRPQPPRMRSVAELLADPQPEEPAPANFERALIVAGERLAAQAGEESTRP